MAKIGLSKPYFAKYSNIGEVVTYSAPALMGKAVELSIELEGAEDNILYADNGPAESANTFAGGTYKITTDDLMPEVMLEVLGIVEEAIENAQISTAEPKWYKFNDNQETPYLGFAAIAKIQKDQKQKYQAVVLPKTQMQNPNDTFKTQGGTIEWGTPEISGTILRDDTAEHNWKVISSPMDTEADAEAAIRTFFGVAAGE